MKNTETIVAKKIERCLESIECHQDVTVISSSEKRGFTFFNKGKEFLYLSIVELSYLPTEIRKLFKSPQINWIVRKNGMNSDSYDPHECDNQLCMLLPNWAINHIQKIQDKSAPEEH